MSYLIMSTVKYEISDKIRYDMMIILGQCLYLVTPLSYWRWNTIHTIQIESDTHADLQTVIINDL